MAVVELGGTRPTGGAFPVGRLLLFSSLGHVGPSSPPGTLRPWAPFEYPWLGKGCRLRKAAGGSVPLRSHAHGLKVHGEAAQPATPPCAVSLLQAPPPPLLLFICLITKQELQSSLLYFCM